MFYYWKRKFSIIADTQQHSFQELEVHLPQSNSPVIEVHFSQGKFIRIEGQVSPAFLRELMQC
ncbi:MAG: hypothetical protein ABIT06_03915 [Saprospiraceae bacterium]